MGRAVCAAALGCCLSCASDGFCLSVRVVGVGGGHAREFSTTHEAGDARTTSPLLASRVAAMIVEEVGEGSKGYDNYDKRVVVWPVRASPPIFRAAAGTMRLHFFHLQVYVDAKKTIAEGRKLPQSQCVEYPQMQELKEVLEHLGFEAAYEEKAYPRDLTQFGRFRVLIKDPKTGEPTVDGVSSSTRPALFSRSRSLSLAAAPILFCALRLLPSRHLNANSSYAAPPTPRLVQGGSCW